MSKKRANKRRHKRERQAELPERASSKVDPFYYDELAFDLYRRGLASSRIITPRVSKG